MKRFALFLPIALALTGCAQLFDSNLFQAVDTPAALRTSDLKSADYIESQLAGDPEAFYEQLKEDPKALAAAQATLEEEFAAVTTGSTEEEKAAAVAAAENYILITANGTDAGDVVNDIVSEAAGLLDGGDPEQVLTDLLGGKSESEITDLLEDFLDIASALDAMQKANTDTVSGTVDTTDFFSEGASEGDLAQIALVAGAVDALAADYVAAGKTVADLAADLAAGTLSVTTLTNVDELSQAIQGDNSSSNDYAYMAAMLAFIPISGT